MSKLIPDDLGGMKVLDVACGRGSWGFCIRASKNGSPFIIGLDIWREYINRNREMKIYDELIIANVNKVPFRDDVFHVVVACEILEHLPKLEGFSLLEELKRVCRGRVIVTTPLGFLEQEEINGNPHERHVSSWDVQDLISAKFKVRIVDSKPLPRSLRLVNRMRRLIFRLDKPFKEIVAWKDVS